MKEAIIDIRGLDFWYVPQRKLFSKFSISIYYGKIYGVGGMNGSGKSTLLRIIGGRVPSLYTPNLKISFYEPDMMPPEWITPLSIFNGLHKSQRNETEKIIKEFGLGRILHNKFSSLSMGQKQKVLLTLVMSKRADVYILDEPFAFLDDYGKNVLKSIFIGKRAEGKTIVFSSNDINDFNVCDEVIWLGKAKEKPIGNNSQ